MTTRVEVDDEATAKAAFATADSNYGREVQMAILDAQCQVCGKRTFVLAIDSSVSCGTSEYGPGLICEPCVRKAFAGNVPYVGAKEIND